LGKGRDAHIAQTSTGNSNAVIEMFLLWSIKRKVVGPPPPPTPPVEQERAC